MLFKSKRSKEEILKSMRWSNAILIHLRNSVDDYATSENLSTQVRKEMVDWVNELISKEEDNYLFLYEQLHKIK